MIFFLIIVCLLCIITIVMCYFSPLTIEDPPATYYQLKNPPGPVEIDYLDILSDIEHSTNQKSLNAVHTRILIFQACYPDSPALLNEILISYQNKAGMINATIGKQQ